MDKKTNLDDYLADLGISDSNDEAEELALSPGGPPHIPPAALSPLEPRPPQPPLDVVRDFLEGLVAYLDPDLKVKVNELEDAVEAEIVGSSASKLIGREGRTLHALETLALTVLSKDSGRADLRVHVDAAGYRKRHTERLVKQAESLATQVMKSGEPLEMEPQTSADRRIIHMTVKAMEGLTTESVGEGANRHVVIRPG